VRFVAGHFAYQAIHRVVHDHDAGVLGADEADLDHVLVEFDEPVIETGNIQKADRLS